ncbi:SsgA family sporulation/cell division regulator [Kitasatospora sp. NPDC048298]|uniref:SsgA family sporulation/cell division regulator n=1 Tax=Kitasatospora sp. NPDC048298 TaxID=3364049 RepID=UPI003710D79D
MTNRNDLTPAGHAADEALPDPILGFDELLAASSLGTPHVTAMMAPLPEAVGARITRYLKADTSDDSIECDTGQVRPDPTPQQTTIGCPQDTDDEALTARERGITLWTRTYETSPKPSTLLIYHGASSGKSAVIAALAALRYREHGHTHSKPRTIVHQLLEEAGAGCANSGSLLTSYALRLRLARALAPGEHQGQTSPGELHTAAVAKHSEAGRTDSLLQALSDVLRCTDEDAAPTALEEFCRSVIKERIERLAAARSSADGFSPIVRAFLALRRVEGRVPPPAALETYEKTFHLWRHMSADAADDRQHPQGRQSDLVFQNASTVSVGRAFTGHDEPHATASPWHGRSRWPDLARQEPLLPALRTVHGPVRISRARDGLWAPIGLSSDSPCDLLSQDVFDTGPGSTLMLFTDGIIERGGRPTRTDMQLLLDELCRSWGYLPGPAPLGADNGYPQPSGSSRRPVRVARSERRRASSAKPKSRSDNLPNAMPKNQRLRFATETTDTGTTLRAQAHMQLLAPDEQHIDVPTELVYRSRDPYAVEISFRPAGLPSVTWTIARDLIADGLTGPAGTGDVRIWSDPYERFASKDGRRAHLSLDSPQGHADLTMPWSDLEEFVTATRKIVPPGREHIHAATAFDEFAAIIHTSTPTPASRPASRP